MRRHWSFVVCDPKYLYPIMIFILVTGVVLAYIYNDYMQFNRVGNLIIGIGVWMSLRYTLREGINKTKDCSDSLPAIGRQLNANFFNKIAFSIGDAKLQIHGFFVVIAGSIIGSYGDLILKSMAICCKIGSVVNSV